MKTFLFCGLGACLAFYFYLFLLPGMDRRAAKREKAKQANKGQDH